MSKARSIILGLLGCILAGCGTSPPTEFLTLSVQPGPAEALRPDKPITVGQVDLPGAVDRAQIVRSTGPNQIVEASFARWAAPLDDMTRSVLLQDLEDIMPAGTVHVGDLATNDPSIDVVNVEVERFDSDEAGHVALYADWSLSTGNPTRVVGRGMARISQTAADSSYPAMAAAMSLAVSDLADRIATQLPRK